MKEVILEIVNNYLKLFPSEKERLNEFFIFLDNNKESSITDWNNFNGHIVTTGFIHAKKENKFLVLHHKDLDMFLSPGGHIDTTDKSILDACIREVKEETGLKNIRQVIIDNNINMPIDIDTHTTKYNERLHLPSHTHFDFRYLFEIEKEEKIYIDKNEHYSYKWTDLDSLNSNPKYRIITSKIKKYI